MRARAQLTLAAASLVLLVLVCPPPAAALRALLAAPSAADPSGADPFAAVAAAAGLLAWALTGWLLVGSLLVLTSRCGGRLGQLSASAARRLVPAGLRRLLALALGVGVLVSVAGPASASAGTPVASAGTPVASAAATPAPSAATVSPAPLDWPGIQAPAPVPAGGTVVVAPGDCLWTLAAARLAAQDPATPVTNARVAAAWPTWWSANRQVIGDDPDLILPGQLLVVPDP